MSDLTPNSKRRDWAWIWLGYSGFIFIDPIFEHSLYRWLFTFVVFAVFLALFAGYVRFTRSNHVARFWMIAAMLLLGIVTFPWNSGASTFFIYVAALLPFSIKSVPRVLALFAAEAVVILAEGYLFRNPGHLFYIAWANTFIAIFLVIIIGGGNIFFAEQKRSESRLRRAREENLALAAVAERERIARDLHDVLGHTLSVIVLKAELARRIIEHDPHAPPRRSPM